VAIATWPRAAPPAGSETAESTMVEAIAFMPCTYPCTGQCYID
jgi:hypothetical protein